MTGAPLGNFASHFERIADLAPDRLAVAAGDRELTWAAFDELADRLAGHLAGLGARAGDRVGIAAWNRPEYLAALYALLKLGATAVNVNYRYRAGEMRHVLASAGARGVIADADLVDVVREASAEVAGCEMVVPIGAGGFGAEVTGADRYPRRPRGDTEWVLFTGGTTGLPKAVLGSQAERLHSLYAATLATLGVEPGAQSLRRALAIDPHGPGGMVALPASPLMHGTGLYSALGALTVGAPVALLPTRRVTGDDLFAAITRHRVTDLHIVGDAFALRLLDALDRAAAAGEPLGVESLRRIRGIGAIWSPTVKRRLLAHADLELVDAIAASEGGVYAISSVTRATVDDHAGTFALAPGARLLDEHDRDAPPGRVGWLAAPVAPGAGYQDDPERTAAAFRDLDGVRYSIPGDMAVLEPDGRVRLLGRGSSVINTGGEKVYPEEVELVLRDHPAVRDAVVLGVPDPEWGSAVAAVVSPVDGATVGADELRAFVAARLAGYKKPRRVVVAPEVRRLATGKADLRWASDQLAGPNASR
ncbi:AMP-binding protein [Pseudonocardia acaciae]|uniref:AMP-binding protein n=1 Tax=Pseudonocardia acaciae TaxID=551276 RepID=UPI00056499D2|nr:AMP-binding protein [Pseudonocardia acaciae]